MSWFILGSSFGWGCGGSVFEAPDFASLDTVDGSPPLGSTETPDGASPASDSAVQEHDSAMHVLELDAVAVDGDHPTADATTPDGNHQAVDAGVDAKAPVDANTHPPVDAAPPPGWCCVVAQIPHACGTWFCLVGGVDNTCNAMSCAAGDACQWEDPSTGNGFMGSVISCP